MRIDNQLNAHDYSKFLVVHPLNSFILISNSELTATLNALINKTKFQWLKGKGANEDYNLVPRVSDPGNED